MTHVNVCGEIVTHPNQHHPHQRYLLPLETLAPVCRAAPPRGEPLRNPNPSQKPNWCAFPKGFCIGKPCRYEQAIQLEQPTHSEQPRRNWTTGQPRPSPLLPPLESEAPALSKPVARKLTSPWLALLWLACSVLRCSIPSHVIPSSGTAGRTRVGIPAGIPAKVSEGKDQASYGRTMRDYVRVG
jgi:hypothetical protein